MAKPSPLFLAALLLAANAAIAGGTGPERIDAFVIEGQTIIHADGHQVHVYPVDGPDRFEARLSRGLPTDPAQAERLARERIESLDQNQLRRELEAAYAGPLLARQYGITQVPAIVFDEGRAVVYGETDLQRAIQYYQRWRDE